MPAVPQGCICLLLHLKCRDCSKLLPNTSKQICPSAQWQAELSYLWPIAAAIKKYCEQKLTVAAINSSKNFSHFPALCCTSHFQHFWLLLSQPLYRYIIGLKKITSSSYTAYWYLKAAKHFRNYLKSMPFTIEWYCTIIKTAHKSIIIQTLCLPQFSENLNVFLLHNSKKTDVSLNGIVFG